MLAWFAQRRLRKRTAQNLYGSIVAASRRPRLYTRYGVADTVEGRFELLAAHVLVVLERLRNEGEPGRALAQGVVDAFFADMDTTTRELGVGDIAVPKKMHRLARVFDRRVKDYSAALAEAGPALADLIAENMSLGGGGQDDRAAQLAGHLRRSLAALERQPLDSIRAAAVRGAFAFPDVEEEEMTP